MLDVPSHVITGFNEGPFGKTVLQKPNSYSLDLAAVEQQYGVRIASVVDRVRFFL